MKKEKKGAVAIKYVREKDPAPRVAAKGWNKTADKIIETAKKNNIPIKEDRDLLQLLSLLDINETIPPSLYKVVAEVLAFVYKMNEQIGTDRG